MKHSSICIALLAIPAAILAAAPAAACAIEPTTSPSFGRKTSFDVTTKPHPTSTATAGLRCGGAIVSLGTVNLINATITSTNGSKLKHSSGDTIEYQMFADSAHSYEVRSGETFNYASAALIDLLGLFGGSDFSLPLYFKTLTGSVVRAGRYQDTITIAWAWNYCPGIGIGGICIGRDRGSGSSSFNITLDVTNDCTIGMATADFGSAPTVGTFGPVNTSISMTCTKGMVFTVGLSPGNKPAANGRRAMANGNERLQYDLYHGNTLWGSDTNRVTGAASDGSTPQTFDVTARIYTDQPTPPEGLYSDDVIIDVQY